MNNQHKEITPEIARQFLERFHCKETLRPASKSWSYYEVERTSWGGPNSWFSCGPNKFDNYKFDTRAEAIRYINDRRSEKLHDRDTRYRIVKVEKRCEYEYF